MEFLWGRLALCKSFVGIRLWVTSYQDGALCRCPTGGEQVPLTIASSVPGAQSSRLIPSVNRGFSWASVTYSCQTTWVSVISFPDFITERRRSTEDLRWGFCLKRLLVPIANFREKVCPASNPAPLKPLRFTENLKTLKAADVCRELLYGTPVFS